MIDLARFDPRGRLADLERTVQDKAVILAREALGAGIVLRLTQGYRSPAEQAALYAKGRTAPGRIVTWAPPGYSWHEFGRAFDVAILDFPGDLDKRDVYNGPWAVIGELGEEAGLEWGGRWKKPDRPHFEDRGGYTLAQLRALRIA